MDKLAAGKEHCQASELEHFKEIARLLFEDVVIERSI